MIIVLAIASVTACEKPAEVKAVKEVEHVEAPSYVERYAAAPAKTMFEYDNSDRAKILKELESMPVAEAAKAAHDLLISKTEPAVGHAFSRLSPETRKSLAERLRARLGEEPTLWQELEKSRLIRIRDEPELTKKGLEVLTKDAKTMLDHQWGVDRFLKSYALQDPDGASEFACEVLSREALPESLLNGSPNQITFAASRRPRVRYVLGSRRSRPISAKHDACAAVPRKRCASTSTSSANTISSKNRLRARRRALRFYPQWFERTLCWQDARLRVHRVSGGCGPSSHAWESYPLRPRSYGPQACASERSCGLA